MLNYRKKRPSKKRKIKVGINEIFDDSGFTSQMRNLRTLSILRSLSNLSVGTTVKGSTPNLHSMVSGWQQTQNPKPNN